MTGSTGSWARARTVEASRAAPGRPPRIAARLVARLLVTALCVAMLAPLTWMVAASLTHPSRIVGPYLPDLRQAPAWENYLEVWRRVDVARMLGNSVVVAIGVVVAQMVTSAVNGFVLVRFRFRGRLLVFAVLLAGLFVPDVLTWVPSYRLLLRVGLIDTLWALIVPFVAGGFGTLVMANQVRSIPAELFDAARIDGCSPLHVFLRIVLPLVRPGIRNVAIATFLFSWSSLTWPLLMTHRPGLRTLPIGLSLLQDEFSSQWHLVMALAVMMAVPPVLVLFDLVRGLASHRAGSSPAQVRISSW